MASSYHSNVNTHILEVMRRLGYEGDDTGICRGFSFVWHQYFQIGKKDEFNKLIQCIERENFVEEWKRIQTKSSTLTAEEKITIVSAIAVLDVIEAYINSRKKSQFVGPITHNHDMEAVSLATAPKALLEKDGLKFVFTQTRRLTKDHLKNYFSDLQKLAIALSEEKKEENPLISFSFRGTAHEFNLYLNEEKNWVAVDSYLLNSKNKIPRGFSSEAFCTQLAEDYFDEKDKACLFTIDMVTSKRAASSSPFLQAQLTAFRKDHPIDKKELFGTNRLGMSLLHQAAYVNDEESLKEILINFPGLYLDDTRSGIGLSPLQSAAQTGSMKTLELLLQAGADVNVTDSSGYSTAHHAIMAGQVDVLDRLLKEPALNLVVDSPFMYFSLFQAVEAGHLEILHYMKEKFPELDWTAVNHEGKSFLQVATEKNREDIVSFLSTPAPEKKSL